MNSSRSTLQPLLYHTLTILCATLFILPLVWVLSASLRAPGLPPPRGIEWIPDPVAWTNYQRIFQLVPLGRFTLNSFMVSVAGVTLTILTASLAGFAMSQLNERMRTGMLIFSTMLLMVPATALWLTRFIIFKNLLIINTYFALIAPAIMGTSPLFILLYYWTFRRVPHELFEASRIDGAGAFRTWASVAMPLAVPTTIATGVLAFVFYWSDFINPLLYLKSQHLYTLAVGLQMLQQMDKTNWSLLLAAAMVMILPVLTGFMFVQRFILGEERLGGIHGR